MVGRGGKPLDSLSLYVVEVWWVGGGGKPPKFIPYTSVEGLVGCGRREAATTLSLHVLKVWRVGEGRKPPTLSIHVL